MSVRAFLVVALALLALVFTWVRIGRRTAAIEPAHGGDAASAPPARTELAAPSGERVVETDGTEPASTSVSPSTVTAHEAGERAVDHATPIGLVLYGRVSLDAAPWPAQVVMTDASGSQWRTTVGKDGHYSLSGLSSGTWKLSWSAIGHRGGEAALVLDDATPVVRRDLALVRSWLVDVRMRTADGETLGALLRSRRKEGQTLPLPPFAVATLEAPGATIRHADPDQRTGVGYFWEFGPLRDAAGPDSAGVLEVDAESRVFVSLVLGTHVLATQPVEPGTEQVTFVVAPDDLLATQAQVQLRAVDAETGETLAGQVAIDSEAFYNVRDGSWSQALPPGRHQLCFFALGHALVSFDLTLAPGETRDLGELRVERELTIEGRLVDADGNAVVGMLRIGTHDERGRLRFREDPYAFVETDGDGRFVIHGLTRGRYVLHTEDEGVRRAEDADETLWASGNVEVSTLGGSVTGLDLRLARASTLTLTGCAAMPRGWWFQVLDERGDMLRGQGFYEGFVPRCVLPPGSYTLVLMDEDWSEHERRSIVVAPGENVVDLGR